VVHGFAVGTATYAVAVRVPGQPMIGIDFDRDEAKALRDALTAFLKAGKQAAQLRQANFADPAPRRLTRLRGPVSMTTARTDPGPTPRTEGEPEMTTKTGYELPKTLGLNLMPKPGQTREMWLGGRFYDVHVPVPQEGRYTPVFYLYGKRGACYGVLPFIEQPLADKGITCVYPVNPTRATGSTPDSLRGLSIVHGADGRTYITVL